MASETEIDHSFPTGNGSDQDANGGGIMMYVRGDIPANFLATENAPLECLFVELNLRNAKWLLNCSYNPNKNMINFNTTRL